MQRRTALTVAPCIETERLVLRGFALDDFEACYAMTADPAVYRHLGGAPVDRAAKWEKFLRAPGWWQLLGYGFWIAQDRASGAVLGEIGYGEFRRAIDPPLADMPEMGWIFASTAHGRGLASEALTAVLAWGDAHIPGPVQCIIDADNAASLRLARRFDFAEVRRAAYARTTVVVLERG